MNGLVKRLGAGGLLALVMLAGWLLLAPQVMAAEAGEDILADEWAAEELSHTPTNNHMADPLEPVNRAFFTFNDRLYFWVLKPIANGYKAVISDEDVRMCFSNAFHNLLGPVRIVNNLLQGKLGGACSELASLVINSTVGIVGLADPAHKEFGLVASDEDLGQTLGKYGAGNGFYICWPFLGPSSVRDTVGLLGDSLLDPLSYLMASEAAAGLSAQGGKKVNDVSLSNGEYEQFKEASFDPYVAVRDAYAQFRNRQIKDEGCGARFEVCRQQEPGGEYQEGLTASIGAGEPEVAAAENDQSGGEIGETAGGERFIVRVGVYVDPLNVQRQRDRLLRTGMAVDVVRYDRESYTLFGVEVPVGGGFAAAKLAEAELVQAGFPETVVVSH